jgi:hypothetical protein
MGNYAKYGLPSRREETKKDISGSMQPENL